jgi:hypothetical protein
MPQNDLTPEQTTLLKRFLKPKDDLDFWLVEYSIGTGILKQHEMAICLQLERKGLLRFHTVLEAGCFDNGLHVYHLTKSGLQYLQSLDDAL